MKQIYLFTALLLLLSGCALKETPQVAYKIPSSCTYYSLRSAECLDREAFLESVAPYPVIFVGDHHDSAKAHEVMLELVNGLSAKGYRVSVANEWFTPDENSLLEQYVAGTLDANSSKALGWKGRAGYDFNLSEPIFRAVIEHGGKLYGINMSKGLKKRVSDENLSGMSRSERTFYDELDLEVTPHKALLEPFFGHCHHTRKGETPAACSARMYRVQVAWDTMMGEESAKLAEKLKEDEKLIVFIGAMHLEGGLGANLRFARKSHLPFVTVLPYPKESSEEQQEIAPGSADLIYLYESASQQ